MIWTSITSPIYESEERSFNCKNLQTQLKLGRMHFVTFCNKLIQKDSPIIYLCNTCKSTYSYRYYNNSWSHFWLCILNWYKRSCLYSKSCTSKRKKMRKRISFLISFGIAFITHLTFKLMFCRWNCRNNTFLSNISWNDQLWEHRYFIVHWTFYCW